MVKQINTDQELVELSKRQKGIIEVADKIQVDSTDQLKKTFIYRQDIKKNLKDLKVLKDHLLKHAKEEIRERNAEFKPFEDALAKADKTLKYKQEVFQVEEDKKIQIEQEKLLKEQQKRYQKEVAKAEKKGDDAPPPPPPPKVEVEKIEGYQSRKVWDFEVVDISKIPDEYMIVDEKKMRRVVKAGTRNIPGVRIFERTISAISQDSGNVEDM